MTTPLEHADLAARYFADVTLKCWARDKDSNDKWDLLHSPLFIRQDVEYYVGHEPPPPIKRTITSPDGAECANCINEVKAKGEPACR